MPVSDEIRPAVISDEFRICPACGYQKGFHTSLVRLAMGRPHFRIVLICPECGTRYDVRWSVELK